LRATSQKLPGTRCRLDQGMDPAGGGQVPGGSAGGRGWRAAWRRNRGQEERSRCCQVPETSGQVLRACVSDIKTLFVIYTAATGKKTKAQTSKQHTSIGQMYQMLLTAVSHLNNACAILSDWEHIIKVGTNIWHITQCVSVRQGRQIFVGHVTKNTAKEIIRIHKLQQKSLFFPLAITSSAGKQVNERITTFRDNFLWVHAKYLLKTAYQNECESWVKKTSSSDWLNSGSELIQRVKNQLSCFPFCQVMQKHKIFEVA